MNSNKILNFLVLLAGIAIMASCSKDKGNYDYKAVDAVVINLENVPSTYSVVRFEGINIAPKITYKGEAVDLVNPQFPELKFTWEIYPTGREVVERHLLSESPILNVNLNQRELPWEILYTITNTNTGIKTFAKFALNITSILAEGWMVLYERNGNTDVGLITNNEIARSQVAEKLFLDIYSASNGGPMKGTPSSIAYSYANLAARKIYVQSNQEMSMVNLSTFAKVFDFNQGLFWVKPGTISPLIFRSTEARKEWVINNNRVHMIDYTTIAQGDRAFSDPLGGTYGTLAPWMAVSPAPLDGVFYDQTNKKFLKIIVRGSEVTPFTTNQTTAVFDVNNVGMELLMGDIGWNNWDYTVMKDNAGKHWLLSANFKAGDVVDLTTGRGVPIGRGKYDMSTCPEIANVNSVTAGTLGEIFYYSANNHLYQFKYIQGTTAQLWTAPGGEVVTNISLQKYYNTNRAAAAVYDPKNYCKILYIATYNETTKIGTVYQMGVNETSGAILAGTEKKYTGFGKIKAMSWKMN
ncbi:PKD-like family lipoprotein [Pedobacter sp. GR22-6]|uniref:PKD-like family lipoprotein n=1 Tax=Pedobacter sp. GR22-6 TaxID=3127957 RepID=UPI00307D6617